MHKNSSEIPDKFLNVGLEKDGDQFDRSLEKKASVIKS